MITTHAYPSDTVQGGLAGSSDADIAATGLRLSPGALFLAHVWLKRVIFAPAGTARYFESFGFPGTLATWSSRPNSSAGSP